ncbi:MAG TPA: hypothetical protein VFQ45_13850 [Longimicrobium sp.]|nr:hypothetical protein [Longimicrobium sp.]
MLTIFRPVQAFILAPLLACPVAAQAPRDVLSDEGITASPPAGYPPFRIVPSDDEGKEGMRLYASRSGKRLILIGVMDPLRAWDGENDLAARRLQSEFMTEVFTARRTRLATSTPEDATHLVSRIVVADKDGGRGVVQIYVPRSGAPVGVGIQVVDVGGATDPAADPAILAFLYAARPRVPAVPPAWREAGLEIRLPPGFTRPSETYRDLAEGVRTFRSRRGTEVIVIIVTANRAARAVEWSAQRRIQHLQQELGLYSRAFRGRSDRRVHAAEGAHFVGFSFQRLNDRPVEGRARLYGTASGPHRTVLVMYAETDPARPLDEGAVAAVLDTVRVPAPQAR